MRRHHLLTVLFAAGVALLAGPGLEAGQGVQVPWTRAQGPLETQWAKTVTPTNVWPEYPRPQLVRADWLNLNGVWDFTLAPRLSPQRTYRRPVLVPFPVESSLSGVKVPITDQDVIWYRRTFTIPKAWAGRHLLLHFGAVDWRMHVLLNGKDVGAHQGGYDPFSFDITSALLPGPAATQEIEVAVEDPTDAGTQPRGKQVRSPNSIWYTPTSGIWQTVWLEPVSAASIASLRLDPDVDAGVLRITATATTPGAELRAEALDGSRSVARARGAAGQPLELHIPQPKLWSPDVPFLYDLKLSLYSGGKETDRASSYFGMRKIAVAKDAQGRNRLFLNNQPLFEFGTLDQGFWPDGLYTAPNDEALRYDIEQTKKLGFNLIRKHVKVEPERWYYWCDKLGMLVWQDMPSGDKSIKQNEPDLERSQASADDYKTELTQLIVTHRNHPSIVMWVPFNEGWGQFDTAAIVKLVHDLDPTRLVDNTSGWSDRAVGDVRDLHSYPGPAAPPLEDRRAAVLGEFGGLGLPINGHTWQEEKNWGYRKYETAAQLTAAYLELIDKLEPLVKDGLAAAIYTQTTDVEIEVNGLMTYDRALVKMDADKIAAANRRILTLGRN